MTVEPRVALALSDAAANDSEKAKRSEAEAAPSGHRSQFCLHHLNTEYRVVSKFEPIEDVPKGNYGKNGLFLHFVRQNVLIKPANIYVRNIQITAA